MACGCNCDRAIPGLRCFPHKCGILWLKLPFLEARQTWGTLKVTWSCCIINVGLERIHVLALCIWAKEAIKIPVHKLESWMRMAIIYQTCLTLSGTPCVFKHVSNISLYLESKQARGHVGIAFREVKSPLWGLCGLHDRSPENETWQSAYCRQLSLEPPRIKTVSGGES